jgi:hypothetical protein
MLIIQKIRCRVPGTLAVGHASQLTLCQQPHEAPTQAAL